MDLIKPGNPRRVMLGMCLQMWSQLCGMNIMMYVYAPMVGSINHPIYLKKNQRYYIVYVFEGAGLTGRRSNLIADVSLHY